MPAPIRIFRYMLARFGSTFAAGVAVFTLLFLMDQASRQVEQLASLAQGLRDFLVSFLLLVPHLLAYTVPLAFLLGMIWTLEQMKQERELTAVLATGLSPVRLVLPFQAAAVLVGGLVFLMTSVLGPAAFQQYNRRLEDMTKRSLLRDMKPGTFFNGVPGTLILVGGFNQDSGVIDGILMVRRDTPEGEGGEMVIAQGGTIQLPAPDSSDIVLQLEEGTLHPLQAARPGYRSGSFQTLTSRIRSEPRDDALKSRQILMAASGRQLRAWRQGEPVTGGDRSIAYTLELHRRLALPVGVLLYPMLVFPAAISTGRHGKAAAFSGSLVLFLATFLLNSVGTSMANQRLVDPVLGAWLADLVLFFAGSLIFTAYASRQRVPEIRVGGRGA